MNQQQQGDGLYNNDEYKFFDTDFVFLISMLINS
jgi:hypothetical protein